MIKAGVDLRGLQPQMAIAYVIASWVYYQQANVPCWITSGKDGKHGLNSLHNRDGLCRALDFRINNIPAERITTVHLKLKEALGEQFDVVLEEDHIHCEFDPKNPPTTGV